MKGRLKNPQQGFSDGFFDVESRTGSIPCPLQLQKRPIVILHRSIVGNGLPGFGQIIASQTAAFLTESTVGLNLVTACLQTALDIQHLLFLRRQFHPFGMIGRRPAKAAEIPFQLRKKTVSFGFPVFRLPQPPVHLPARSLSYLQGQTAFTFR